MGPRPYLPAPPAHVVQVAHTWRRPPIGLAAPGRGSRGQGVGGAGSADCGRGRAGTGRGEKRSAPSAAPALREAPMGIPPPAPQLGGPYPAGHRAPPAVGKVRPLLPGHVASGRRAAPASPAPPRLDGSTGRAERAPAGCCSFSRRRASSGGSRSRPPSTVSPHAGAVSAALPRGQLNSGDVVPCDDGFFPGGFILIILSFFSLLSGCLKCTWLRKRFSLTKPQTSPPKTK